MRPAAGAAVAALLGAGVLAAGTDGFRAFTTEQTRRLDVVRRPRRLPPVALEDQDGRPFVLAEYGGRPLVVDFIYTQCRTVCGLLSASVQRMYRLQGVSGDVPVPLVSISFDAARDSRAALAQYASKYGADGRRWRFARVTDARDLPALLAAFGVVVVPDSAGDFEHNAAVHLVNREGRLARIVDLPRTPDEGAGVLSIARR